MATNLYVETRARRAAVSFSGEHVKQQAQIDFLAYVREHHVGLRAFIRAVGVDPLWVDDIAQEAFIVAYERLDEFDETRDFGRWVRGIARNLVINERRKDARRKRILSDHLTEVLVATSSEQDDEPQSLSDRSQARLRALHRCLNRIPEKSRAMIRARYEDDAKAPDIAEEFGMKAAAVRKSLERIRTALKKCVEDQLSTAGT